MASDPIIIEPDEEIPVTKDAIVQADGDGFDSGSVTLVSFSSDTPTDVEMVQAPDPAELVIAVARSKGGTANVQFTVSATKDGIPVGPTLYKGVVGIGVQPPAGGEIPFGKARKKTV